jgi:DNA-binding NtrC family response regulator
MPLHVLLMEDNPSLADQMSKALIAAGHHCRSVNSVASALREIGWRMPQIVLADYQVTDGTAEDLLIGLSDSGWDRLPVVISTAVGPLARETAARYPQVKQVLDKPVATERFVAQAERFADPDLALAGARRLIGPEERSRILQLAWSETVAEPSGMLVRS